MINEYDKGTAMQTSTVLGDLYHVAVEWASETGLFRHLSSHVFGVRNSGNTKPLTVIFFSKYLKFNVDFKKQKNIGQNFLVFEIIASELISLNCLY